MRVAEALRRDRRGVEALEGPKLRKTSRMDGDGHDSQTQRTPVIRIGAREDKRVEEVLCISFAIRRDMDGSTVHRKDIGDVSGVVLKVTSSLNTLRDRTPVVTQVDRICSTTMTDNQHLLSS